MSLQSRSTQPAGRQAFTLSAQTPDRGSAVWLTVTVTVPWEDKADYQAFWRTELKAWLSALAGLLELIPPSVYQSGPVLLCHYTRPYPLGEERASQRSE